MTKTLALLLIPIIYATLLFVLPRSVAQKARRRIADFIIFQWGKGSLISAIVYVWFTKNGNGNGARDLTPYLDGDK